MDERVTISDLEAVCRRINRTVNGNQPDESGTPKDMGPRWVNHKARIGMYYVDGAYGGYALYRIMNEHGGVTDVFNVGHVPKRELRNLMFAYLEGVEQGRAEQV